MEENRIYYKELPCYQSAKEKEKRRVYSEPYFDLGELPEGELRQEIGNFIRKRGEEVSFATILHDKSNFKYLAAFLQKKAGNSRGLKDWEAENGCDSSRHGCWRKGCLSQRNLRTYMGGLL